MDWQPIETAPLDKRILICAADGEVFMAWNGVPKDEEGPLEFCIEIGSGGWDDIYKAATHWMPLPEPPAIAGETGTAETRSGLSPQE